MYTTSTPVLKLSNEKSDLTIMIKHEWLNPFTEPEKSLYRGKEPSTNYVTQFWGFLTPSLTSIRPLCPEPYAMV